MPELSRSESERFSVLLLAAARIIFLALRVARREFEYTIGNILSLAMYRREEGEISNVRRPRLK
jgi:hypothetical protein